MTTIPLLSVGTGAEQRFAPTEWPAIVLALAGTLCLIWRRQASLLVLGISATAFCLGLILGYPPALPLAPVIALYTLAVGHSSAIAAGAGAVVGLAVAVATGVHHGWRGDTDDRILENLLLLLIGCMLGYGIQIGRARRSVLIAQENRLARAHAAATERAIRDEKSRIARELHDVVAHHVSVITAQAAGAQRVFDTEPEQARQALRSIETTGRSALTEMRRLLGVLQIEADDAEVAPQPRLDHLPLLSEQMRQAGLPVDLRVDGDPRPLSAGVELNAYRIVQEALTNTLKHAGSAHAEVVVSYRPARLDLQICDNGHGFAANATLGHGLIGMRQRAAMLGGQMQVGPASGGGVRVLVTLPTGA